MKIKKTFSIITTIGLLISTIITISTTINAVCTPEFTLPDNYNITMMIEADTVSTFTLTISQGYDYIPNGTYLGWCIQKNTDLTVPAQHSGALYSSYDTTLPPFFTHNASEYIWETVNYLLNHREDISQYIYTTYDNIIGKTDIQTAIWNITCDSPFNINENPGAHYIIQYLTNESRQTEIQTYCPEIDDILVILVDTFENTEEPENSVQHIIFEYPLSENLQSNNKPKHGGSNGGVTKLNTPPTADGSVGAPYQGIVDELITFYGTRSYDFDGEIIEWNWSFGNGDYIRNETAQYSYKKPGIYYVTLTVSDNDGATDIYETTITINLEDRPPSKPVLTGEINCDSMTRYFYTVRSKDPDNDTIRYTFDWGDGTPPTTTDYKNNNTNATKSHIWEKPGLYLMKVFAEDEHQLPSKTIIKIILVDISVIYINDQIKGYLIDEEKNGIYVTFHNNLTGTTNPVQKHDDQSYLIDSNDDGIGDLIYDIETNTLNDYAKPKTEQSVEFPIWLFVVIIIVFLVISIPGLYIYKKRLNH